MFSDSFLLINSISKTFINKKKVVNVLQDINLNVKQGEFISIFGPNACGKTTFINIISEIDDPSSGSIVFSSSHPKKISVVFQDYNSSLLPWKNCLKNIYFPLEVSNNFSLEEKEEKVQNILELLGIGDRLPLKNYPYQMSGGEKQLTCIARALITEPELLLFDEPFASLDFQTRLEMISIVENVWLKTQKTVIFVSHDIDEAIRLANRLLLFSPRPATIKNEYHIFLNRPRSIDVETDRQFIELKNSITKEFTKMLGK